MNPKANALMFFIAIALFGLGSGIVGYYVGSLHVVPHITLSFDKTTTQQVPLAKLQGQQVSTKSQQSSPTPTPDASVLVDTTGSFMKDFGLLGSDQRKTVDDATVLQLLSTDAQHTVKQQTGNDPLVAGLSRFASVPNPPVSFTVGQPHMQGSTGMLTTTWSFLSGSVTRVFHFTLEGDSWKIDKIQSN